MRTPSLSPRAFARTLAKRVRMTTKEQSTGLLHSAQRRWGARPPPPIPPKALRFMGEDDALFVRIGDELVEDLRRDCGLTAGSRVLDVGSGYGRFAHALLRTDFTGSYLGFDILPRHIDWCRANLAHAIAPSVRFVHVDVENARYNPKGTIEPVGIVFPCKSASIDVVLMASVFTHMYPAEVLRYLSEIRRVLKPGGSALVSFFVLGLAGATGTDHGCAYPMTHTLTPYCRYSSADDPLFAIAYEWTWLEARIAELGLTVRGAPAPGTWAGGRPQAKRWQDLIVLAR